MRTAFFTTLAEASRLDPRVELLVGDVGYGAIEAYAAEFPGRCTNTGISEQNMAGVAAGLALSGSIVFTYSIGNFPSLRCLEQLRNDVCYHHADVKIVSVGGGLAYGTLGVTHHATEDLAVMRAMPGMAVAAPGDPAEVAAVTRTAVVTDGPVYVRLGKAGEPAVHDGAVDFALGQSIELRAGNDVAILACGTILPEAVAAAALLCEAGVSTRVVSMPWIEPLDVHAVRAAATTSLVVTVEEHSVVGGLGGAVAEVLSELGATAPLLRIGLPRSFTSVVGDTAYLRHHLDIDAPAIARRVLDRLDGLDRSPSPSRAGARSR